MLSTVPDPVKEPEEKSSLVIPEAGMRLEKLGIKAITLHPRTTKQSYAGNANWKLIKILKESVSIPVIGNGDVKTAQDVLEMMKQTGCDGVMVGRAAVGNPWFFNEAVSLFHEGKPSSTPSISQRITGCKKHFDHMLQWHGEKAGTNLMRKHFGWYIRGFDGASYVRKSLVSALDKKEMISILNSIV